MHLSKEKTLVIIKPDGVQRSLIGEIIKRFETVGLKLVALELINATEDKVKDHYEKDDDWKKAVGERYIKAFKNKGEKPPTEDLVEGGNRVLGGLVKYMTSGPVVVMVWQGAHAVEIVRKITGGTEPLSSDVGTIRGDYVLDSYEMSNSDDRSVRNLIHTSGTIEEAEEEIKRWVGDKMIDYKLVQESILYDVDIDGIYE